MTFALDLANFAEKAKSRANLLVGKVVIDIGTALVLKSPVGDADYWQSSPPKGYTGGRFRANWQYGLNAPDVSTHNKIDKSGGTTINVIVGKVSSDASGKVHFITNTLPYAKRLEDGWSRQAPNGMVKLTVQEFIPIVNQVAQALNNE